MSVDEWKDFFINSGFQDTVASNYAHIFFNNRMRFELLSDLTKEYLKEMKITFIGDMMTILRYAKKYPELKISENVEGSEKKNFEGKIVEDESKYEIFEEEKVFLCDFCNDNFTEKKDLDSHVKTIHTVFKPRKIKHSPEKSNESLQIPFEGEFYSCEFCNDHFTLNEDLDSHVKTIHTVFKPRKIKNVAEKDNNLQMKQSFSEYKNVSDLSIHVNSSKVSEFQLSDDIGNSKSDYYKCNTCDKSFLKISNFKNHMAFHKIGTKSTNNMYDDIEGDVNGMSNTMELNIPEKLGKPKSNKNYCPFCGKIFIRDGLNQHLEVTCGAIQYKCLTCSKKFSTVENLKRHLSNPNVHKQHLEKHTGYYK